MELGAAIGLASWSLAGFVAGVLYAHYRTRERVQDLADRLDRALESNRRQSDMIRSERIEVESTAREIQELREELFNARHAGSVDGDS